MGAGHLLSTCAAGCGQMRPEIVDFWSFLGGFGPRGGHHRIGIFLLHILTNSQPLGRSGDPGYAHFSIFILAGIHVWIPPPLTSRN